MKSYGRCAVSEFLGDRIVYRNLSPADPRLPGLAEIATQVGLRAGVIPRKSEADYARVIVHLLQEAHQLDAHNLPLKRLVFIGDTRMNDTTAFANICQAGGLPGLIFIGEENQQPLNVQHVQLPGGQSMFLANRWNALAGLGEQSFNHFCEQQGFPIDSSTAVLLDMDKTILGARGRNAHTIDQARVQAVQDTVERLLGDSFNLPLFLQAYDTLKQQEYHPFTADNQDYLAYICLVLGSQMYELDDVIRTIHQRKLLSFQQFILQVDVEKARLAPTLLPIHEEIFGNVQRGDPTPFKAFRYNEYRNTIGKMGHLPDTAPVEQLLAEEIVITQEVRALALAWRQQGALLFGLSDKPDEATFPTAEYSQQGYLPLHHTTTHSVGEE